MPGFNYAEYLARDANSRRLWAPDLVDHAMTKMREVFLPVFALALLACHEARGRVIFGERTVLDS